MATQMNIDKKTLSTLNTKSHETQNHTTLEKLRHRLRAVFFAELLDPLFMDGPYF